LFLFPGAFILIVNSYKYLFQRSCDISTGFYSNGMDKINTNQYN
jgi:hypothetical protein